MRLTPLVRHAMMRVPALSDLFSDALAVTSIAVVSGGTTTITTSAAHGVTIGEQIGLSITDAEIPNLITAAEVISDTEVKLTTSDPHDLTTTPDAAKFQPWHTSAKLTGFGSALLDGAKQLLTVHNRNAFSVVPSAAVGSISLEGDEYLLERLERDLVGWKRVTAATTTTLTFPTPTSVTRSYTVTSPSVVRNHRIFGAVSLEAAVRRYVRDDNTATPASAATMWITPVNVRASRSKHARTDALSDINDGSDYRQLIIDGFEVLVVIPIEHSPGGVYAVDLCHGDVLQAVLKTFFGLKLPYPDIFAGGRYVALLEGHEMARMDNANYYHRYKFQTSAVIINEDAIAPYNWADLDASDIEAVPDSIPPIGAPAFHDIDLDGIRHQYGDESMTATIKLDE